MRLISFFLALLISSHVLADWTLSQPSRVNFVSIKNNGIAEIGHFKTFQAKVMANGEATLKIDLSSVNTGIDIRDERMQKHLFNTEQFTHASFTSKIPADVIEKAQKGEYQTLQLKGSLELHGQNQEMSVSVDITPARDGHIRVASAEPLLIKADDFALLEGINKLQEIAGLKSIVSTIPLTFSLLFNAE